MAERMAWADARVGDVLSVNGAQWTVKRVGPGKYMTLKSQSGVERIGQPDPAGLVTVVERGPDPGPAAVDVLARKLGAQPLCGHWIGDETDPASRGGRYCGSDEEVRQFVNGYRCPDHTPGLVQARAAGRRACESCGQPVPVEVDPGSKCLVCHKPVRRAK